MTANRTILTVLLSTLIFTLSFYNKSLGINLLLFESAVLLWLLWIKKVQLMKFNVLFVFLAVLLSALFSVIHHTNLSIKVNILCFFLFVGVISEPSLKSLWNSFLTAFSSFFSVFYRIKNRLSGSRINQKKIGFKVRRNLLLIVPMVIILGFTIIYGSANPKFGELVTSFFELVLDGFNAFFASVNLALIGVIILGAMVSLFVFVRTRNEHIAKRDADSGDQLYRTRRKILTPFSPIGLTNEYRSAVFLFLSLNCLLLVLNVLDINYVWFNFKWEGQYLKDFVHNGVYVLLFAILVSILLVLFVFRANLNFYRKGIWLKRLTYFWLTQNLILAVSVGIRNWYYIDYYALADRRIAIFFFLLLVAVALFTVFVKVHKTRSTYYFIRTNVMAVVVVLVLSTFFNWDRIIARYNFEHANKSFIHLNYLVQLSDASLPYLDRPLDQLIGTNEYQKESFFKVSFSSSSRDFYNRIYMTPEAYLTQIEMRKKTFIKEWKNKSWLEWNYAEYQAFRELIGSNR